VLRDAHSLYMDIGINNEHVHTGSVAFVFHAMVRGKTIPEDIHWIIIRLGSGTTMTEDEIAMYTDISVRSVRKILSCFRRTGGVNFPKKQIAPPQLHKSLCDYDIEVCITPFFAIVDQ
jgi:transcription initiation factor IIE alpha subunit